MSKYTEWYPADVKPVHISYYHLKWAPVGPHKGGESLYNYYWDGEKFTMDPIYGDPDPVTEWIKAWRGLTEQAK